VAQGPEGRQGRVKELGQRGFTRKIAILDKYDTKLQCGQCHVEYNCNPGTDPVAGKPVSRPTSAPTTSRSRT